jgi:hypothetical protein
MLLNLRNPVLRTVSQFRSVGVSGTLLDRFLEGTGKLAPFPKDTLSCTRVDPVTLNSVPVLAED